MRNQVLATSALLLLLAACAAPPIAPPAESAAPAPAAVARVIQVHDVRDLVTPPGDAKGVSRLADQVREQVVFAPGGEDPGASIAANGTAIVVVATAEMQRKVSDYLLRQREAVKPNGL